MDVQTKSGWLKKSNEKLKVTKTNTKVGLPYANGRKHDRNSLENESQRDAILISESVRMPQIMVYS